MNPHLKIYIGPFFLKILTFSLSISSFLFKKVVSAFFALGKVHGKARHRSLRNTYLGIFGFQNLRPLEQSCPRPLKNQKEQ